MHTVPFGGIFLEVPSRRPPPASYPPRDPRRIAGHLRPGTNPSHDHLTGTIFNILNGIRRFSDSAHSRSHDHSRRSPPGGSSGRRFIGARPEAAPDFLQIIRKSCKTPRRTLATRRSLDRSRLFLQYQQFLRTDSLDGEDVVPGSEWSFAVSCNGDSFSKYRTNALQENEGINGGS
jgi:hypothetical protein